MTVSSIALIRERVNRNLPPDVYDVWLDPEAPPEVLTGRSRPYMLDLCLDHLESKRGQDVGLAGRRYGALIDRYNQWNDA